MQAGVVRDVPELDIYKANVRRNMFAEYNDRIYSLDKDFPAEKGGKKNVLLIGNSFARDMGNILLESEMADQINISYIWHDIDRFTQRIREADYVFVFNWKHAVPYQVWDNLKPDAEVWGIGTKNFGACSGNVYRNRNRVDYYEQTVEVNPNFILVNSMLKKEWRDHYLDFMEYVQQPKGASSVRAFTDTHKLFSQDCAHLTKAGAQYYANSIIWKNILKK